MITPDTKVPDLDLPLTNGLRYKLSEQTPDNFTLLVFYRGKHCPICRNQLEDLSAKLQTFTENGVSVVAVSMDSKERAMHIDENWNTGDVPLAYELSEDDARKWGLYISEKRPDSEEPEVFSEPGMFLVRPDLKLYFASTQNAPFTRPPLDELIQGIKFIVSKGYPTRGTLT